MKIINKIKSLSIILGAIASLTSGTYANALELKGKMTQGSMIIGKAQAGSSVKLNDKEIKVSKNGDFVFGFGRDEKLKHILMVTQPDGIVIKKPLTLTKRTYQEDRLTVESKYVAPDESVYARIRDDVKQVAKARAVMTDRMEFLSDMIVPAKGRISGVYGSRRILNGVPKRPHFGLDIAAPTGTEVIAPIAGKVVLVHNDMYYTGGTLIIEHGFGVTTTYIHLSKILVKQGQTITQGQPIAHIGATGRVTGPHLDWRLNWGKVRLDPALLVEELLKNYP